MATEMDGTTVLKKFDEIIVRCNHTSEDGVSENEMPELSGKGRGEIPKQKEGCASHTRLSQAKSHHGESSKWCWQKISFRMDFPQLFYHSEYKPRISVY